MKEANETKHWEVRDFSGKTITFFPVFTIQDFEAGKITVATDKEVECKEVKIRISDEKTGKDQDFNLGFQELFMFVYYCANEEIRRALQLKQERKITNIPYEVTFKLSKDEIQAGMAKRLISLPVDEITMAIARSSAQLMAGKATLGTIETWFADKRRKKRKQII